MLAVGVRLLLNLQEFDEQEQTWLRTTLATFLDIAPDSIRLASTKGGESVTCVLELPQQSGKRLVAAYARSDPELELLLAPLVLSQHAGKPAVCELRLRQRPEWPPPDIEGFIRGDRFLKLVNGLGEGLTRVYPHMRYADALALIFDWFERRIGEDPEFITLQTFPTFNSFRAYVKQAVFNAAGLAEQARQRRDEVTALPTDQFIVAHPMESGEREDLIERVEALPFQPKLVFKALFFDEETVPELADRYGWAPEDIWAAYHEAIDLLGDALS
jgi:hypothetical protein